MMVDTGASITLVMRKWAEAHGLSVMPVTSISISGANSNPVETVGTCSMMLQLSPTLELDVSKVNVLSGDFYQRLFGGNILGVEMAHNYPKSRPRPDPTRVRSGSGNF